MRGVVTAPAVVGVACELGELAEWEVRLLPLNCCEVELAEAVELEWRGVLEWERDFPCTFPSFLKKSERRMISL